MSQRIHAHYERMPSQAMDRRVHLWRFGHGGRPFLAMPTSGGYAHEWQQHGAVDALGDLLARGLLTLYCPESNVSQTWADDHWDVGQRMARHHAYERFVTHELVPRIWHETGRGDVVVMGASVGAMYAVNFALKHPRLFSAAVGLSGRYDARAFTGGWHQDGVYFSDPLAYVWNLHGAPLQEIQRHTHVTVVVGQGNFEGRCLPETHRLADALASRGIPHHRDVWGHDVSHEWPWWQRQIRYHVARRLER